MPASTADTYRRFLVKVVRLCARARWAVTALAVVLTGLSVWYLAANMAINSDTEDMLSAELPFRQRATELKQAFPELGKTLLVAVEGRTPELVEEAARALAGAMAAEPVFGDVFYPAADPFFRRNGLLYRDVATLEQTVDRLTQAQPFLGPLWQDPTLRGLGSLVGRLGQQTAGDGLPPAAGEAMGHLFTRMAEVAEARLAGAEDYLSWRGVLSGGAPAPLAAQPFRRLIVAQPSVDYTGLAPGRSAIRTVERLTTDLGLAERFEVQVRQTGPVALAYDELQSVREGMGVSGALSLLMVAGLLWWAVKSVRMVLAAFLTLLMGLVWTAALGLWMTGALNLISVAFAVLFIGLSVDFGIHFSLRYKESRDRGGSHADGLDAAAGDVGDSLTLSAIAAALGFLAFLPTDYKGLAELGLISGVGMGVALVANLTVLPALITLMPPNRIRLPRGPSQKLVTAVEHHPRAILGVAGGLALVSALLIPRVDFDFDPLNLKDPQAESVQTLRDLMAAGTIDFYAAQLLRPNLEEADEVAARLAGLDVVAKASTVEASVPDDQDDKLALVDEAALVLGPSFTEERRPPPTGEELEGAVTQLRQVLVALPADQVGPETAEAAARLSRALDDLPPAQAETALMTTLPLVLTDLDLSLQAEGIALADLPPALRDRWLSDTGAARVEVAPAVDVTDRAALARFVAEVRQVAPGISGTPVTILEAGTAVITALLEAGALSAAAIAVMLAVVLRSVRGIVYVFAPLVMAALVTAGASVVLGIPLNFANVIVLPLLFGLGVASGIHIVQRARATGRPSELLATSTPRAVIFSTLTTIASFASLATSPHQGTASMGILLTVAVGLTLLSTLVVLPALMSVAPLRPRSVHGS